MARPRVLHVGHTRWRVMFSPGIVKAEGKEMGYELDGICLKERQVIAIHPQPEAPDTERTTVVHEVLHACLHETGLTLNPEQEEEFITCLAPRLLEALQQNPTLVRYLLD